MEYKSTSNAALAASITRAASQQTYYTIRYLVDQNLVEDAYRAYAYFRWVDDWLDGEIRSLAERLAFVERQRILIETCYQGRSLTELTPEECLLVDLIRHDAEKNSKLQAYIHNMMAVMSFDANRRGQLVTQQQLNQYTHWLAVAVTEALHHFIGHRCAAPHGEIRYLAVTGAHITHILRDALDDAQMGYYNVPQEVVASCGITPWDVHSQAYRDWVKASVHRARACFRAGRDYLARVENLRCRMAGFAYIHRFEVVLDCIEREGFLLRAEYPERKRQGRGLEMAAWALWMALRYHQPASVPSVLQAR